MHGTSKYEITRLTAASRAHAIIMALYKLKVSHALQPLRHAAQPPLLGQPPLLNGRFAV